MTTTTTTIDTRQRIIEAATRAMIEKSYNGVGLNEILSSAGVPKGSFYHFFKSKEQLGIAVVEKATADKCKRLREHYSNRNLAPLARLQGLFQEVRADIVEGNVRSECVMCKLALEQAALSDLMRVAIRSGYDQFRALTAQVLREAQSEGEIDANLDAESLSDFLTVSFQGAMIRVEIDNELKPVDNFLHYAFEVLLK
ncbi:TetR/AcrR family transcriptional regulator [Aeoliella sp. ICT_H6.2]|uniref:TetR/AcrR family transcriptional regulator n=1 Tax=Aeoliella straminimaris TaxID=2954799 RepID=A0A9X2JFM2_9BACT|nr:TetR/AcrR family transcriptional regulator [Aeoliella straminimaris]MCO6044185.1 TetR/AcrR family transcriptional regulator [Aeoliella straminimaris]